MMPQRETGEPLNEHVGPTYGGYAGDQSFARVSAESSGAASLSKGQGEKVYPIRPDNTNMFRLIMFVIAMLTLLLCAVLCIFFIGGTGGWVSLIVAAFVIFLVTVVAIDKIV
jgi:hypothetical protein